MGYNNLVSSMYNKGHREITLLEVGVTCQGQLQMTATE